jgi:hypothetical protein
LPATSAAATAAAAAAAADKSSVAAASGGDKTLRERVLSRLPFSLIQVSEFPDYCNRATEN